MLSQDMHQSTATALQPHFELVPHCMACATMYGLHGADITLAAKLQTPHVEQAVAWLGS